MQSIGNSYVPGYAPQDFATWGSNLYDAGTINEFSRNILSGVQSYSNTSSTNTGNANSQNNAAAIVDRQLVAAVFERYGKNGKMDDVQIAQATLGLANEGYQGGAAFFATMVVGGVGGKGLKPPDRNGDGKVGLDEVDVLFDVNGQATPDRLKAVYGVQATSGVPINLDKIVQIANSRQQYNPFQFGDPYSDGGGSAMALQQSYAMPMMGSFPPMMGSFPPMMDPYSSMGGSMASPISAFSLLSAFNQDSAMSSYADEDNALANAFSPFASASAYFDS